MNNNRRRNFRGRPQKNNFRRRVSSNLNNNGHYSNNAGNKSFSRNGPLLNPASIEKVISKYQQLAKDAQSNGDPVLAQNYLQHADHYLRRYNELNERRENINEKTVSEEKSSSKEGDLKNENQLSTN